jgi:DNA-binding NarL/FixJ family response regulator
MRSGLRMLLTQLPGVEVAGEAGDGRQAADLAATLRPDIAFLDVDMPGCDGIEATALIAKCAPATRVVILTMHVEPDFVARALRAGACGYLLKTSSPAELEFAMRAALSGGMHMSPEVSRGVVDRHVRADGGDANPLAALTARQREILKLIAEGRNTKRIAADLGLSGKTVEAHRAQMMTRLGVRDVPSLVRLAMRAGLVQ